MNSLQASVSKENCISQCFVINQSPPCLIAHVITIVSGVLLSTIGLAVGVKFFSSLSPLGIACLVASIILGLVLVVVGANYLIHQYESLKIRLRDTEEIKRLKEQSQNQSQQIEELNKQVVEIREPLNERIRRLEREKACLETDYKILKDMYDAELLSGEEYENSLSKVSKQYNDLVQSNGQLRAHNNLLRSDNRGLRLENQALCLENERLQADNAAFLIRNEQLRTNNQFLCANLETEMNLRLALEEENEKKSLSRSRSSSF
ncbi:hypothetical protein [Chlamydia vaughanii]|uniref:hypothetical protein n=1 Tax=Chlamydia vaughanii TaxID=3112552 RepID=UPI0032B1209C